MHMDGVNVVLYNKYIPYRMVKLGMLTVPSNKNTI